VRELSEHATRILVVDDDPLFVDSLVYLLQQEGYAALVAPSAEEALGRVKENPDLVLLDIGLPGLGGVAACRRIRAESDVPIIMITGRRQEADKIVGLDAGADDYVTKPIAAGELLARVRAVLRRKRAEPVRQSESAYACGSIRVDAQRRQVLVDGASVELTPREYDLLLYLLRNQGRVMSRQDILDAVWGPNFFGEEKALDVYISQLRRKVEADVTSPRYIHTVRGVGYRLEDNHG
jgi:two-component system, OmpR family, response regulator RegX3